jgi:plasmid maintenance system antidote protein VapI
VGNFHPDLIQRRIVTLGAVPETEWVSELLVQRCRSEKDAVILCWTKKTRKSLTIRQAAEELNLPASHLSNILSGKKYLPHDFRVKFQKLCGNWAIRQYEDHACGFRTTEETAEQRRIRELESKLERYERTA